MADYVTYGGLPLVQFMNTEEQRGKLGSKGYYIQSALSMPNKEKIKQEKNSLLSIHDSFKKIILVKDVINIQRDEQGIITMSIFGFLLKENSLEL